MKRTAFFILILLLCGTLSAQNYNSNINTITTAVPFIRISPDARTGGMGEGGIALADDVNAMHWNVSKLAFNEHRFGLSASYTPWLRALVPDINLFYGAVCFKPDSVSAIGASIRYFSMGEITYTNAVGAPIGQVKPREMAVDIGYARKLCAQFSVGLSLRYIYSDLSDSIYSPGYLPGKSYAGDLGLSWQSRLYTSSNTKWQMKSGLALTNIGTKIGYDTIDSSFIPTNLGVAWGIQVWPKEVHRISFQVELNKVLVPTPPVYQVDPSTGMPVIVNGQYVIVAGKDPNRSVWEGMKGSFNDAPGGTTEEFREINWSFGAEYSYSETFKVRAGYFYEHELKGARQFITLGAGVAFKMFQLDFAYLIPTNDQRSPMQNTLRFTLMWQFDSFKIKPRGH